MHPLTQTILAAGVLALVGMGGFVTVYGLPERAPEPSALDRLTDATDRADASLCRFYLSRDRDDLNAKGRAERLRCLRED